MQTQVNIKSINFQHKFKNKCIDLILQKIAYQKLNLIEQEEIINCKVVLNIQKVYHITKGTIIKTRKAKIGY